MLDIFTLVIKNFRILFLNQFIYKPQLKKREKNFLKQA